MNELVSEVLFTREAGGGGGGTPLNKLHGCVRPERIWFLSQFGLKYGINVNNFVLKV